MLVARCILIENLIGPHRVAEYSNIGNGSFAEYCAEFMRPSKSSLDVNFPNFQRSNVVISGEMLFCFSFVWLGAFAMCIDWFFFVYDELFYLCSQLLTTSSFSLGWINVCDSVKLELVNRPV